MLTAVDVCGANNEMGAAHSELSGGARENLEEQSETSRRGVSCVDSRWRRRCLTIGFASIALHSQPSGVERGRL